jgi:DNA polymerase delta subunit 1
LLTTDDPTEKRLLEGRSNALKVSANSVYGFTGAQVGQLPCLAISSSVTSYGRKMLEMTRTLVTEKFSVLNGYPADAHVLYGDTDSVMISFGVKSLEQTIELGKEAAEYVSSFFAEPICLVFEKCYSPFLLMQKKRYAGLLWHNPKNYEKIDCKGIETVRRDNCPLVKDVVNNVLKKILIDRSYEEAINYCKSVISDLLQNRIDLSLLVISKGLGKKMKSEKKEDNQY